MIKSQYLQVRTIQKLYIGLRVVHKCMGLRRVNIAFGMLVVNRCHLCLSGKHLNTQERNQLNHWLNCHYV